MKIGELAKKFNCTVETIRYYEKNGLIPASVRDSANNYRHYQQRHIDQLTFVRHCRALAMSHAEILELLKARRDPGANCHSIDQIIDEHLQHVSVRIAELQFLEDQLHTLRQQCKTPGSHKDCGIIQDLDRPLEKTVRAEQDISHVSGSH